MRPSDWSAAGFGTDPIPGEPDTVRRGGQSYLEMARTIDRTARGLRTLDLDSTVSEAIDALSETARSVASDIARAEARYRATGNALTSYAAALAAAQDDSLGALRRAEAAQSDATGAQQQRRRYLYLADAATDPADALRYERLADDAGGDARQASAAAGSAREDILAAATRRDRAAEDAREQIENTTSGDDLGDSWWDDWGKDVLAVITDVAGAIAGIAGILALVVSWIPVIGQVLAAALLLVAGIAAVVNAIGNVVLAASGERSWGEAVISIIGAALSVVGLGAAARLVGSAASAARINAAARLQQGFTAERNLLTVREALRLRPSALAESEALWRAPLSSPSMGDDVYRVYGRPPGVAFDDAAHAWGASYSPTPPWQYSHVRESLGLPVQNAADNLLIARIADPDAVVLTRHALPLDGNPGGAAEYIIPGPQRGTISTGLDLLDNIVFSVR
ncbi:MAG: hypothetical protein QM622_07900 [Microbacterium sp.]